MRKIKTPIRAEKREQKNRKRMHLSGGSLRSLRKFSAMSLIKLSKHKNRK